MDVRVWLRVRWACVPLGALIAMIAGEVFASEAVRRLVGDSPLVIANQDVVSGLEAAFAAVCMGSAAWWFAPFARRPVITVTFLVGSWLAWEILEPWWFSEGHPRAYEPSHVPIIVTLVGGLIAYAVLWVLTSRWPGVGDVEEREALTRLRGAQPPS